MATKILISVIVLISPSRVLGVEQSALLKEPTVSKPGRIAGKSFLDSYAERECILHTFGKSVNV